MPDQRVFLKEHPAHPSVGIDTLSVSVDRFENGLKLIYEVRADLTRLVIPEDEPGMRRDGLWKHTCFELFLSGMGGAYVEYNFSPGGDWAAYQFSAYRAHGQDLTGPAPAIATSRDDGLLSVSVIVSELPEGLASHPPNLGLTAVIENAQGDRSYWALDHRDETPDFHRPETFILTLD